jgi:hypothetical protein
MTTLKVRRELTKQKILLAVNILLSIKMPTATAGLIELRKSRQINSTGLGKNAYICTDENSQRVGF